MAVTAEDLRRDVRVISLVGAAHFFSHFFQLALPPLFPVLKDDLGVTYVALGFMMSVLYAASGLGQTISGFLVDRFGARRILLGGMAMLAGSVGLAGLATSFWTLVPIALVTGLGNSVFHPADYSIMNASVTPRRLGRAYSVHGILGTLGFATGPAVVVGLAGLLGWRAALLTTGGLGLLAVLCFARQADALSIADTAGARGAGKRAGLTHDLRLLLTAPILIAFVFFTVFSSALTGIQTFSVPAMIALYDAPLGLATGALTAYLLGSAPGILLGGFLADRASRPDLVAGGGILLSAAVTLVVASGALPMNGLPVVMALAGAFVGCIGPSRDLLVRRATPAGGSGKVFGFVYSGLDLGSSIMPMIFGWLLDRGEPRALFVLVAALLVVAMVTVLQVRGHSGPAPAPAPAGAQAARRTLSMNGGAASPAGSAAIDKPSVTGRKS